MAITCNNCNFACNPDMAERCFLCGTTLQTDSRSVNQTPEEELKTATSSE